MAKEELLTIEGVVDEILPDGRFGVMLDNQCRIIAYTAGKMRRYRIRSIVGDRVHVEMTPYDLSKGRIVFREKLAGQSSGAEAAEFPTVNSAGPMEHGPLSRSARCRASRAKSAFWREMKAAASEHLAARGEPRTAIGRRSATAAQSGDVILVWFGLSYGALLFAPTLSWHLLAALSLAFAASALGFCVFHDANHRTLFQTGRCKPLGGAALFRAARSFAALLGA